MSASKTLFEEASARCCELARKRERAKLARARSEAAALELLDIANRLRGRDMEAMTNQLDSLLAEASEVGKRIKDLQLQIEILTRRQIEAESGAANITRDIDAMRSDQERESVLKSMIAESLTHITKGPPTC